MFKTQITIKLSVICHVVSQIFVYKIIHEKTKFLCHTFHILQATVANLSSVFWKKGFRSNTHKSFKSRRWPCKWVSAFEQGFRNSSLNSFAWCYERPWSDTLHDARDDILGPWFGPLSGSRASSANWRSVCNKAIDEHAGEANRLRWTSSCVRVRARAPLRGACFEGPFATPPDSGNSGGNQRESYRRCYRRGLSQPTRVTRIVLPTCSLMPSDFLIVLQMLISLRNDENLQNCQVECKSTPKFCSF